MTRRRLLERCFLQAVRTKIKDKDLPMDVSVFYLQYMRLVRPANTQLDVRVCVVAVCWCSVLVQGVVAGCCCRVLLQGVVAGCCCSVLQCVAMWSSVCCRVLQGVVMCCSVLQCGVV